MATLKNLVDETTNIKNELITCHTNLRNNLIAKGVECSDTDKMTSLIDKVDSLNVIKGSASPGEVLFILFDKKEYAPTKQTTPILTSQKVKIEGGYRVQFTCGSINNVVIKYGVKHMRNNTVVSQKMFNYSSYAYTSYTYDFSDVRKDDFFEFYAVGDASGTYLHMKDISVSCEVEI